MPPKYLGNVSDLLQKIAGRDEMAFATVFNYYSKKVFSIFI
jgi:hypothetical protein